MNSRSFLPNPTSKLSVIGGTEYISIGKTTKIPAKIDTGADSSAIWASNIEVRQDGTLTFKLFAPDSPYYTGEILETKNYTVVSVRSSNGLKQFRYRTNLTINLSGHTITAGFTLADRHKNIFPVLIGRKTISNRFIVDVSKANIPHRPKLKPKPEIKSLNQELKQNPYKFHQKHFKQGKTE
jgi:hypothetical protein